tara:strand:+ start:107 stop:550 length:444 start_codon:yes stop_codon:yes gene_type:complete
MIEPLLISSSVLLGKEFVNQTITKTTNNIYGNIDAIIIDSSFEFKNLLDDLDITTKLDIINSFICNLKEDNKIYSKTILKTLDYLIDIFKKIEKELDNIKLEITEHKKKWFHTFRTPKYKSLIHNLIKHLKILDNRFDTLLNLLKIN